MRFRGGAVAVLVGLASAACSLGSFTGYSSGGVDANGDASSTDGAASDDGGNANADGNGSTDGGGGDGAIGDGGCVAKFCDDFERVIVDQGWDQLTAQSGGAVTSAVAPDPIHGGMRGASVFIDTDPAGRAFIEKKMTIKTERASLSFWMNLPAPARVLQVARIRLDEGAGKGINFFIQTKTNGAVLVGEQYFDGVDYVGFASNDVSAAFKAGTWQHWKLELDATVTPHRSRTSIDGVVVRDDPLVNAFAAGTVRAYIGVSYAETGPAMKAFFDDVAVDFSP